MVRRAISALGPIFISPFGVVIISTLLWVGLVWILKIPLDPVIIGGIFVLDIILAFILPDRLTYFFSQFILPIQTPKDRQEIYSRVQLFESGDRGQTLFVKNGRVIKHKGEEEKKGLGVIVLDTASAVVLRTDTEIVGPVGPGVRFTTKDEYIVNDLGVDLRPQWQYIGPHASAQPFLDPVSNPKSFNDAERRRQETLGLTRDGFEVSPTISIKYGIRHPQKNMPTESGVTTRYKYDPAAVRNAVTRELIELGKLNSKKDRMDWNKLPAHLAVNVWREYIRKFKLEDLFNTKNNGLQAIEEMLNLRLQKPVVPGLNETGERTNEATDSPEFFQLKMRGIEIMEVRIHNVVYDQTMEEQYLKQWSGEWLKIAKKEEEQLNEEQKLAEKLARIDAAKTFARLASRNFISSNQAPKDEFGTLEDLIQPIREALLLENRTNNEMELEIKKLEDIAKWLLVNKADGGSPRQDRGRL